jgi:hypothetical protein
MIDRTPRDADKVVMEILRVEKHFVVLDSRRRYCLNEWSHISNVIEFLERKRNQFPNLDDIDRFLKVNLFMPDGGKCDKAVRQYRYRGRKLKKT